MHDSKRELALQKMMNKKEAAHSKNEVVIADKIKPDELNALNNKTNYPKAAMRLQFDQYPDLPRKKKNKG